jgi:hypothetical protein
MSERAAAGTFDVLAHDNSNVSATSPIALLNSCKPMMISSPTVKAAFSVA